jgi:hypothetical protein
MMATTHALAGLALAAGVAAGAPELGTLPVVAAALGGVAPDLDIVGAHRRTLHFPVSLPLVTVPAVGLALAVPRPETAALALFLAAAALHSASDVLGAGLEPRPWEGTAKRAVYDHVRGRWFAPRRWIRYDGAPEDLLLAALLAIPSLLVFDGPIRTAVVAALVVSTAYASVRKRLFYVLERLLAALPEELSRFVPEHAREE